MNIGIVGSGADKFTPETRRMAQERIRAILAHPDAVLVSGHSPVGGIDIWAEEAAAELGRKSIIHAPVVNQWGAPGGYKDRNLAIARDSDIVVVIVVKEYPPGYTGMRFNLCYHCKTKDHVKSGGCYTAHRAYEMGKAVSWVIL